MKSTKLTLAVAAFAATLTLANAQEKEAPKQPADAAAEKAEPKKPESTEGEHDGGKHEKGMLKKFDANGDGVLSDEEKAAAKAAMKERMLKKFDANGDGVLSDEELKAAHAARKGKKDGGAGE